jgi:alkanesulfonate monooxygenase SsuD/methylene tetrahydromethanopterin reductase-like flavin-dependent oxidoreductase (luciferase family)
MKVAVGRLPRSINDVVRFAQDVERLGYWALGIGDSHYLYHEVYPAATACLLATSSIRVGPFVTNFVARNWSIHASTARTFEELSPGRFVLGIASGDGSVYSVGLRPQPWHVFEDEAAKWRERSPQSALMHVTVSGPRGAESAGRTGDAVVVATGADVGALNAMCGRAETARRSTPAAGRLERWSSIIVKVVEKPDDVAVAREEMLYAAIASARYSLAFTFEDKNVPEDLQGRLREALGRYNHQHHASRAADNPNRRLLDHDPALRSYIQDRMIVVGTRDEVSERLHALADEAGLDGIWVAAVTPDGPDIVRRLSEALGSTMRSADSESPRALA